MALLRCVAGGDRTAFAELCHRLQRPLFGYLMTVVQDRVAAEDLLGETGMEIWRQATRFEGRIAVNVWAFSLAHRRMVNHGNAAWNNRAYAHRSRMPADAAAMQDAEHRSILNLAYHQEFSVQEIGDILGISAPTVRVRMFRARQCMNAIPASG